jgi:hypothetical protein
LSVSFESSSIISNLSSAALMRNERVSSSSQRFRSCGEKNRKEEEEE